MTLTSTMEIFSKNTKNLDGYIAIVNALVREVIVEKALEKMCFMSKDESRKEFECQIDIYKNVYGDEGEEEMREVYRKYEKAIFEK